MKEKKEKLLKILGRMPSVRVLVVGDLIIDHFIWGVVERISPEAPVPVVRVDREELIPGGAANVARNLISLKSRVLLAGVVGSDGDAGTLLNSLDSIGLGSELIVVEEGRPTTKKTRIVAHSQQVVRFDRETDTPITPSTRKRLLRAIEDRADDFDAIIVSDYGKGLVGRALMDRLRRLSSGRGLSIAVDPKPRNARTYYDVDLITPNHHEAGQFLGMTLKNEDEAVEDAGERILKKMRARGLLITRAALGMTVFAPGEGVKHIPTVARQVFDVTGAGDSVIAATVLAKGAGATWGEAASIANYAAGVVVAKVGTATVSLSELKEAILRRP